VSWLPSIMLGAIFVGCVGNIWLSVAFGLALLVWVLSVLGFLPRLEWVRS
jgi:hypothetical protein